MFECFNKIHLITPKINSKFFINLENYSYKINPELTGLEKVLSFDDGEIGGRLIIKFKNFDSHSTWFASFSPGKLIKSSSVAVISTPNPNIVCVFYSGKIYLINTLTTEKLSYKEQDVVDVIYDDINNVLLIFTFVGVSCFLFIPHVDSYCVLSTNEFTSSINE